MAPQKSLSLEVNWGVRHADDGWTSVKSFVCDCLLEQLLANLNQLSPPAVAFSIIVKVKQRKEDAPMVPGKFLGCGVCNDFSKSRSFNRMFDASSVSCLKDEVWHLFMEIVAERSILETDVRGYGVTLGGLMPRSQAYPCRPMRKQMSILDYYDKNGTLLIPSEDEDMNCSEASSVLMDDTSRRRNTKRKDADIVEMMKNCEERRQRRKLAKAAAKEASMMSAAREESVISARTESIRSAAEEENMLAAAREESIRSAAQEENMLAVAKKESVRSAEAESMRFTAEEESMRLVVREERIRSAPVATATSSTTKKTTATTPPPPPPPRPRPPYPPPRQRLQKVTQIGNSRSNNKVAQLDVLLTVCFASFMISIHVLEIWTPNLSSTRI
eukprot:gnl/MRDRNA2_/MRDRNA2_82796_c0_seq1.p2 gnl/MRDRNA2_/MRDRNA2_82796_c0~~gnl/MRDRNA2_/MRDRNA2_82796_c0_seq1.p2  ORF type:complete len:404 (+),score=80.24 gnl/MRDRNA2_/MRDRNA2_82796_c0_seq1:52-1212(+)